MAGCAVTFLRTQDASNQTHGRGVSSSGTNTLGPQASRDIYPTVVKRQTTTHATQTVDSRQRTREEPGVQIQFALEVTGAWTDRGYTCTGPAVPAAGPGPLPAAGDDDIPAAGGEA